MVETIENSILSTLDNIPPRLISELRRMSTEHLDPQYDDPSLDFDPQTDRDSRSAMRILSGLPMAGGVMTGPETILSLVRNPESEENQAYVRENRSLLRAFPLLKQLYGYSREVDPTDYKESNKLDVEKDDDIEDFSKLFGRDNLPEEYQYTTDVRKRHDIKSEINRLHTFPKEMNEPIDEETELRQRGGIVDYQEGGDVLLEDDPAYNESDMGFVGSPEEAVVDQVDAAQNGDMGGDNVDAEVPEGSFVLNSYAVELAGIKDIEKLIKDAKKFLMERKGEEGFVTHTPTGEDVEVRVSEGEYIIPSSLVRIIGRDRLEKINKRGIVEFERQQAEETEMGGEEMPQEPREYIPQEGEAPMPQEGAFSPEAEIPPRSVPADQPELDPSLPFNTGGFVGYALGGDVTPQASQSPNFSEDTFRLARMSSPPQSTTTHSQSQQQQQQQRVPTQTSRGFMPNAQQQQQRIEPGALTAPDTSLPVSGPLSVGSKKKFNEGGNVVPPVPLHKDWVKERIGPISSETVDLLARVIWGEAKGEDYEGMQAVANTMGNRAKYRKQSIREVIEQPKQYSVLNNPNSFEYKSAMSVDKTTKTFRMAKEIANKLINGELPDITKGSDHYYNPKKVIPPWASSYTNTKKIGNHQFLNSKLDSPFMTPQKFLREKPKK